MLKLTRFAIALAVAGLVSPAFAGSWPNGPTSRGDLGGFFTKTLPSLFSKGAPEPEVAGAPGAVTLAQDRAFRNEEKERPTRSSRSAAAIPVAAAENSNPSRNAFTEGVGDSGWDLAQHKYIRSAGRFVHSQECDHAIRVVKGPTPAELEAVRAASPGG